MPLKSSPIAELQKLDAGTWKSPMHVGEKIPTLDGFLNARPEGKKVVIEIKDDHELTPELATSLTSTNPSVSNGNVSR